MSRKPSFYAKEKDSGEISLRFFDGISDEARRYIENPPRGKYSVGFVTTNFPDLEFLSPIKDDIVYLETTSVEKIDWSTINTFKNLTSLGVDDALDLLGLECSSFKNMYSLDCFWCPFIEENISSISGLRKLRVGNYKANNVSSIDAPGELEVLSFIYSRKMESLDGIGRFRNLSFIELDTNSQLRDISALVQCKKLQTAIVFDNNKIEGYEIFGELANLEELLFGGKKASVNSLRWLSHLKKLELLRFDCRVVDGDLSVIRKMSSLKHLKFKDKRNFNEKYKELNRMVEEKSGLDYNDLSIGNWRSFYD